MTVVDFVIKWGIPRYGPADLRAMMQDLSAGGMKMGECASELPPAVCAEMEAQGKPAFVSTPPPVTPTGGQDFGSKDRPSFMERMSARKPEPAGSKEGISDQDA